MNGLELTKKQAKAFWIRAQRLDTANGFASVKEAVEHLGYVQIDTISVVERCHHHILFNRLPKYRRADLQEAQTAEKSVFEYWTHALSYVPARDFRFYRKRMLATKKDPSSWYSNVNEADVKRVLRLIKTEGPISIRDIDNDVLVEKNHAWGSRKPSKKALELAFYSGDLVVSERVGMLKKYELTSRHFGWDSPPKPATDSEITTYLVDRALTSQSVVSVDSICHLNAKAKPAVRQLLEQREKSGEVLPVRILGVEKAQHWIRPADYERPIEESQLVHILSPFDPLVIQRKRLKAFFDYEHLFEAYIPKEKRVFGYFALPVLVGDQIVALVDLKTDRSQKKLLVQSWHWLCKFKSKEMKKRVEEALQDFEDFQLRD
ncbi:MAG: winged helix DNA-binding domain-containing protein [Proteobacteria bacterium]|nr:MAG: winged helix DNA-binding domain-containing protein [Pseudomonadota bacterium]